MGKRRFILAWLLITGLAVLGGCSRQDTELLGNIGRKLMDRAGTATATYREKMDHALNHKEAPAAVE